MGDAVMPAERVFVEENPDVSHAERYSREKGRKNPPAPQATGRLPVIEAEQVKSCKSQARGCPCINHEQVLVSRPQYEVQTGQNACSLQERWTDVGQLPENEAEKGAGCHNDQIIDNCREHSPLQCRGLQRYIYSGTLLLSRLLDRFDRDSAQRRGRWENFWNFQDARPIDDRIG